MVDIRHLITEERRRRRCQKQEEKEKKTIYYANDTPPSILSFPSIQLRQERYHQFDNTLFSKVYYCPNWCSNENQVGQYKIKYILSFEHL